jgi:hypothetical protein
MNTNCNNIPTIALIEESKNNMDTINGFVKSPLAALVDQYGNNRMTMQGMEDAYHIAESARDVTFDSQYIYKNGGKWADAPAQITEIDKLTYWIFTDGSGYAVKGSVILPIAKPSNPVNDDEWFVATSVNKTQMRTDSASQLGLVYFSDWYDGITIASGAMTAKSSIWHGAQFYSIGTDAGFTSNDFDADLAAGRFVSQVSITRISDISDCVATAIGGTRARVVADILGAKFYAINYANHNDADSTSDLHAMFNNMSAHDTCIIDEIYNVTHLQIKDKSTLTISGSGAIIGIATDGGYVLELLNCTGITSNGRMSVSGNVSYICGVKTWGEGDGNGGTNRTTSLHSLDFIVTNCKQGWIFGDESNPDGLCSEIVIHSGYTYNVPIPLTVIGTQTVIESNGYQLISAGVGDFAALPHSIAVAKGGVLHINGGECQMPAVSSGWSFVSQPIKSTSFDNSYGKIFVSGSAVESAGLWFITTEPVGFVAAKKTGCFVMESCSGYHSFAGQSVQTSASFSGQIKLSESNDFHAPNMRTVTTVGCANDNADVWLAENFGTNFIGGVDGVAGGTVHFKTQRVLVAAGLNRQTVAQSTSDNLKFSSVTPAQNIRFYNDYNPDKGIFTVPTGGLKDVHGIVQVKFNDDRSLSPCELLINNSVAESAFFGSEGYGHMQFDCGNLSAGDTISVRFTNLNNGTWTANATNVDKFVIYARN